MDKINEMITKISNLELSTFSRILIAIGIVLFFLIIRPLLSYIMIKIFKIKGTNNEKIKNSALYKPLKIFFLILGIYLAILFLGVPDSLFLIINRLFRVSIIILIACSVSNALKPNSLFIKAFLKKTRVSHDIKIINLVCNIARVLIFCIAIVISISELGYDINGLIAGLGLSGVTIALAAQDTAKNLFGGMVIFFDKPFAIGEWIQTEKYEGIVEEITFRSTRIRTWDDSVVTIPNSDIANSPVINWTKMNLRRIKMNLILEYRANLKQLCNFTNDVQTLLESYDDIVNETITVKFTEMEDSGYNIYISCKTPLKSYSDYISLKENINYKIIQILEKNKIDLAYPSQTIYLKK
ncbi:MAG: mechanosensitive ion channel family protein [Clostridia bacterium]|nr:mechanosensitive ion channel family protein [Clostridia bacterium]